MTGADTATNDAHTDLFVAGDKVVNYPPQSRIVTLSQRKSMIVCSSAMAASR